MPITQCVVSLTTSHGCELLDSTILQVQCIYRYEDNHIFIYRYQVTKGTEMS